MRREHRPQRSGRAGTNASSAGEVSRYCSWLRAREQTYTRRVSDSSLLNAARFDIASFGELISDPSRVSMLLALMDGSARPASELARLAGVAGSTASAHLKKLVNGGALVEEKLGRHRYYRLAGEHVADVLESVALLRSPRDARKPSTPFTEARTCYRHLAGRLGVQFLAALEQARFIDLSAGALTLSTRGVAWCGELGITHASWPLGKPCLDWTERRFHLGGPLGGLLTERLLALRWIAHGKEGRAVRVTRVGAQALSTQLGLRWGQS